MPHAVFLVSGTKAEQMPTYMRTSCYGAMPWPCTGHAFLSPHIHDITLSNTLQSYLHLYSTRNSHRPDLRVHISNQT